MSANLVFTGGIGVFISIIVTAMLIKDNSTGVPIMVCSLIFFAALMIYGFVCETRNNFYENNESVKKAKAEISICVRQQSDLEKKLENLLKEIMANYKSLADAVKARNTENLQALLNGYPELKGNTTIKALMKEITGLRKKITVKESEYNTALETLISKTKSCPDNLPPFMPAEFRNITKEYISEDGKTENKKA